MNRKVVVIFILLVVVIVAVFSLRFQRTFFVFSSGNGNKDASEGINFLVLGKTGKVIGWNFAPDLADSIFLVNYVPKIGVVNLISLPRDLYVNIGNEQFKLNEIIKRNKINEFLKGNLVEMTGIKTDRYVVIDVDFVKQVVDDLGGIEVNLPSPAIDWASGYTMPTGNRHLTGEDVVWLVRNRYSSEGDFFREKNQHAVIKSIFEKYKNLGYFEKAKFVFKALPLLAQLEGNINVQEFLTPAFNVSNLRFNDIVFDFSTEILQSSGVVVPVGTSSTSTAYILVPRAGQNNYSELKDFIQSKIER
ncbi:MAG: LCP family protein [Candidatus Wolfebacteria bacterium]|nr:LCP family protein [Candidatus Wolfebacteria bacterium]